MTTVRALTVRQPYADAIVYGPKRIENRPRPTKYRGLLLIHAGLATYEGLLPPADPDWPDERGAVIGSAQLVGCHRATEGCCPEWGFRDSWHWELAAVQALAVPLPARGALGLWTPSEDILRAIHQQHCPTRDETRSDSRLGCQPDTAHGSEP
ncbi:hypothetical protein ACFC1R_33935 [Kitasatospora sp. NPDC056138]|uniref:hypothetical protein n=1 Tax=Kitasatospora sp. NPDC056138 TaxID=3345724 RepID=UPI0035DFED4A